MRTVARPLPAIPVLNYHHVHALEETSFRVTPDQLQAQLEFLLSEGYRPLHLDHLIELRGTAAPSKSVVVTFDDAYEDFLWYAWPILKALQIPTLLFVIGNYIGQWNDWDPIRASPHRHLNLEQLKTLQAEGVVIGFHTRTHPPLVILDEPALVAEIRDGQVELEQKLGMPIRALAYPGGHVNNLVRRVTARSYELGFATSLDAHGAFGDPYLVPRFDPSFCGTLDDFGKQLEIYSGEREE